MKHQSDERNFIVTASARYRALAQLKSEATWH